VVSDRLQKSKSYKMATPNASKPIDNLAVVQDLVSVARRTPPSSYARQQVLLLILSTVQGVLHLESLPSFSPSSNPEVQDDGENEGEDGENEGKDGENEGEDGEDVEGTAEGTAEDTRQLVDRPKKEWYALVKKHQKGYEPIPDVAQFEVRPYIMARLTQMLNGTVDVYEVERVWFNHQADGWNVVFTFEKSPLKYAYPIDKPSIDQKKWMKIGYLHIKESFQHPRD
jgi:hypothetical protein